MIAKGVARDLYAVAVTPEARDAILSALEDPPAGLVELRGALMRVARSSVRRMPGGAGIPGAAAPVMVGGGGCSPMCRR
jgi:hypothetical protein